MFERANNKKNNKKTYNNKKGVTLIMLIIAVAMIAIVASFAVFYSQNTTPEAKMASAYSSLKAVKDACGNALALIDLNPNEYDDYYFFGNSIQNVYTDISEINELAVKCGLDSSLDFSDRTYIIKPAETSGEELALKNLELKAITDTYIVDLEKNNYYILDGIKQVDGPVLYEYRDIVSAYEILVGNLNNVG